MVVVDKILYLVGTLWEYTDIKQFALHRFKHLEVSDQASVQLEDFTLKNYIDSGHFEYIANVDDPTIQLKLKLTHWLARHLSENPLSEDQIIEQVDNENRLSATIKNTHQLRWWLLGLGLDVEVLEPAELRKEFQQTLAELSQRYEKR